MFGHKWEKFSGAVADMRAGQGSVPGQRGVQLVFTYAIDAQLPDGTMGRIEVSEPQGGPTRQPGSIIALERNAKTGEVRIDPDASAQFGITADAMTQMQQSAAQMSGLADGLRVNVQRGRGANIFVTTTRIGPDGSVTTQSGPGAPGQAFGADVQQLAAEVMSGDPAARAQAIARLREMKSQLRAQAGGMQAGFGQPAGQGSPQERIAHLQQLRDQGMLSQAEYDAKRQQIIDQI